MRGSDSPISGSSTRMACRFPGDRAAARRRSAASRSRSSPAASSTVSSPSCSIAAPSPEVIDRVELEIPDRSSSVEVEVLGSATGAEGSYATLSTTPIYAVRGAVAARSTTAVFPSTDYRYFLVRARGVSGSRRDRRPRSAAAAARRRQRGLERPRASAGDRGDARSRVPERSRRRGRGAVEHRTYVRAPSSRARTTGRRFVPLGGAEVARLPRGRPRPRSRSTGASDTCG